jgi:hypothetical protein
MAELTPDEELELSLQALDGPGQEEPPEPNNLEQEEPDYEEVDQGPASPVLAELEPTRRPSEKTVCEDCPNSVWFASKTEVKCYCRVMFVHVWTNKEPNVLIACDGIFVGQEE